MNQEVLGHPAAKNYFRIPNKIIANF